MSNTAVAEAPASMDQKEHQQGTFQHIRLADIQENPDALRGVNRTGEKYLGLVESIREVGVLKPVNVRQVPSREDPQKMIYGLIDGAHRFTASQDAGMDTIPAYVLSMDDGEVLEAQIMANVHTIETKPAEYSEALIRLLGQNPTMTINTLSKKLAKSPKWLQDRLSITKLDPKIQKLVDENKIPLTNAYALAKLKDHAEQLNFLDRSMTDQPGVFVPLITSRVKEIQKAKREGKEAGGEQFVPIPHARKLKDIEEELKVKRVATQLKGAGRIVNVDDFLLGLQWASHTDPDSIEAARQKYEQKKKDREENKRKSQLEKAQKQQEEANKILQELGKNEEAAA